MKPADETPDGELIRRMQEGDARACDAFVRRWYGRAYAVALAVLRHGEDARDATQDALVRILRRIGQGVSPDACGPWVHTVARNCARTLYRKRQRAAHADMEEGQDAAGAGPDAVRNLDLLHALGHLQERERMVLLLHDMEGLLHAEIARDLGISELNSRQLLFVARGKMRAVLKGAKSPGEDENASG